MGNSTIVASAARTTSSNSTGKVVDGGNIALILAVTAVTGTNPTLDVVVQWSADGTNFFAAQAADSFTQVTATGGAAKLFTAKGPIYRVAWTVGGTATPTFTFSVDAFSYQA
jgi:hypothetical protein